MYLLYSACIRSILCKDVNMLTYISSLTVLFSWPFNLQYYIFACGDCQIKVDIPFHFSSMRFKLYEFEAVTSEIVFIIPARIPMFCELERKYISDKGQNYHSKWQNRRKVSLMVLTLH